MSRSMRWRVDLSSPNDHPPRADFLSGRRFRAFSEARAKPHRLNMSRTSRSSRWREEAKYVADARPIGAQAFPSHAAELRLVLHPSTFLVASRFPIVTSWEINQSEHENGRVGRWSAECGLVPRPFLEVEVRRLPPGGDAFISALSQGRTIAAALDTATAADPMFDIAINRALLIEANVVIGIREQALTEQLNV